MTVYTVCSCDDHPKFGTDHYTIGSFTTYDGAVDECVDYIMERLQIRIANDALNDLAFCMANDENHPEAKEFFSGRSGRGDSWRVKRGKVKALRAFLRGVLRDDGCYYACLDAGADPLSFHFDIDENDVVGELWHTVTWGDSDCEDPNFTTPWPEAFTSEESAIENFYHYALDMKISQEMPVSEGFKSFVYESLRKDGKCQVDLDDGCSVSCVLYHDDAKNIRE